MEQYDLARYRSGCGVPGTGVALGGAGRERWYGRSGMFRAGGPGIKGNPSSSDACHSREPSGAQCPALTSSQVLTAVSGYTVIERPISQAADPVKALEQVLQQINGK